MNLFIVALKEEIEFDYQKNIIINNQEYFYINDNNILVFSDVGKMNASFCVLEAINNFKNIKNVFNLGSCGSFNKNNNIGDILLVKNVQLLDFDLSAFNYEINQIPRKEKYYYTNNENNSIILKNIKEINFLTNSLIGTIDTFINKDNFLKINESTIVNGVDMELFAIAFMCHLKKINFNSIKYITDCINCNSNNQIQFNENLKNAKQKLSYILNKLLLLF